VLEARAGFCEKPIATLDIESLYPSIMMAYNLCRYAIALCKENTSSTNEAVNTAHEVSTASSQGQASSSTYADDVMFSFFVNQSNSPQLDNEDLEQIDTDDLEEMDLKWRGHFARECRAPRNQGNRNGDAPRRIAEEGLTNFALMAYTSQGSSSSSSSDSEVHTCSKDCLKSYEILQKQYDQQRDALNKSNLEIIGYQIGLESIEARIVVYEKNEDVYEEDIAFLKYDVQVKDISIKDLKNQLEEALKEKDDLKLKLEKFEESSKNITKLINNDSVYKAKVSETITISSKTSKDSLEKPKTVRPNALIIEDWDIDSDNDSENTHRQEEYSRKSQSPRDNRRNWNGMITQKLGNSFEFIKKDCFICGSFNHLIKDCDFHDKKIVEKPVLNNKQLQQSPSGQVPVNAAKQSSPRAATSISTARPVNTDAPKPKVNDALPITYSYFKAHSRENAVQSSHAGFGDQQEMVIPTKTLQDQGIFNSGCSRHMTGNKSFLTIIKKYLVEFVAFRGSPTGGIKRKFSVSRTPQQNGFGLKERKDTDRATRTVLADFIITYNLWAEAVRTPSISFMRPFGCPVTILNTLDPLVKFDGKADESWEATSQLWKQPMNCQTYSHNQKYIGNMPKYQIIGDINSATQTRRMIKISEEHAMINDWIIDILEGQPKLGLWYPRDSPFDLEAFSDSDYAGASLDRKSTTGEIRENISSGMIPYEKKLIQVIKIHTDHNVADLLTKSFDVSRFNFLIA
ncbi:ribonuclease H-like domain-containing protein, partial [Tanacetum coccineum]